MSPAPQSQAASCDFGLIGLAVMGENLALNIESRGFSVAVFNRTTEKVDDLLAGRAKGKKFVGCHSVAELVKQVKGASSHLVNHRLKIPFKWQGGYGAFTVSHARRPV